MIGSGSDLQRCANCGHTNDLLDSAVGSCAQCAGNLDTMPATEWCVCGHAGEDHEPDLSGMAGSPCWHGDSLDGQGYPVGRCDCADFAPASCADSA